MPKPRTAPERPSWPFDLDLFDQDDVPEEDEGDETVDPFFIGFPS